MHHPTPKLLDESIPTIGSMVKKVTGDYKITGTVRSIFTKDDGGVRLVVEHTAEGGGSFLHIYSPANLVTIKAGEPQPEQA